MVSLALNAAFDRWPSVRAVFLEADVGLVSFYRDLRFWWVSDLDYKIPVKGGPASSLPYEPMYFPRPGSADEIDDAFAKKAVLAMARDNFGTPRHDQRWLDLETSMGKMNRLCPEPREDADGAGLTLDASP
jgi:hypothetical protein